MNFADTLPDLTKAPKTMKEVRELHEARQQAYASGAVRVMSVSPHDVTPLSYGTLQNLLERVAMLENQMEELALKQLDESRRHAKACKAYERAGKRMEGVGE